MFYDNYDNLLFQVVSVEDLCCAYPFLARFHLKKKNFEEAEKYAHKCCEYGEVCILYIIKCMCMFSWWISSNDTTSTVFPKCKCLLILMPDNILSSESRKWKKSPAADCISTGQRGAT